MSHLQLILLTERQFRMVNQNLNRSRTYNFAKLTWQRLIILQGRSRKRSESKWRKHESLRRKGFVDLFDLIDCYRLMVLFLIWPSSCLGAACDHIQHAQRTKVCLFKLISTFFLTLEGLKVCRTQCDILWS